MLRASLSFIAGVACFALFIVAKDWSAHRADREVKFSEPTSMPSRVATSKPKPTRVETPAQISPEANNSYPRAADGPEEIAKYLPQSAPVFEWTTAKEEDVVMNLGTVRRWNFPASKSLDAMNLRVEVDSDSSVSFGIATTESLSAVVDVGNFRSATLDFSGMTCSAVRVTKSAQFCKYAVNEPTTFVVRDDRFEGTAGLAFLGAWMRNKTAVDRATTPNRVKVVFKVWKCITNCSLSAQ